MEGEKTMRLCTMLNIMAELVLKSVGLKRRDLAA